MDVAAECVGFGFVEDGAFGASPRVVEQRFEDVGCREGDDIAVNRELDWVLRIVGADDQGFREVRSATVGQWLRYIVKEEDVSTFLSRLLAQQRCFLLDAAPLWQPMRAVPLCSAAFVKIATMVGNKPKETGMIW